MTLVFACLIGCSGKEDKAWNKAYQAHYDYAYMEARNTVGKVEGAAEEYQAAGTADATRDAERGTAWRLYRPLVVWSLCIGIVGGVFAQYAVLLACRRKQSLPLFLTAATVPGVRLSRAYQILEIQAEAVAGKAVTDIELQEKLFRIRAIHQLVTKKLMATENLDQLTRSKLLELANVELEKIVSSSERKYGVTVGKKRKELHSINCPHCGKAVKYSGHFAGQSKACPNAACNELIEFPA